MDLYLQVDHFDLDFHWFRSEELTISTLNFATLQMVRIDHTDFDLCYVNMSLPLQPWPSLFQVGWIDHTDLDLHRVLCGGYWDAHAVPRHNGRPTNKK